MTEKEKGMKVIHCADLHLDSKMESKLSREQAKERRYEILETFENMVGYGRDHGVRVIMIVGDLFDTPQKQQKTIKDRVLDIIKNEPTIDFHYLQGNHDQDDFFRGMQNLPDNLKLYEKEWKSYSYNDVVISGIELTKANQDIYYDGLHLDPKDRNLVLLHGQVISHSGMGEDTISLPRLRGKHIEYLALGHLHEYRKEALDEYGVYCYSGCLEGRGFDECGEKGFVVLDIVEDEIITEFISIAKRTFHERKILVEDATDFHEVLTLVQEEIEEISSEDLISLKLVGKVEEEFDLDISYLEQLLKRRFYYGQVKNCTELQIEPEKYKNDKTLKGQFIRTVQELELSEQDKKQIMQLGLRAIAGKEVLG